MESPSPLYIASLATSSALTVSQIVQSYALRGFATPRLASVARARVLGPWVADFAQTQGLFQQALWTIDTAVLALCLRQTPPAAAATLWLWRGALLCRVAHMAPILRPSKAVVFIWDVMTKSSGREFRDEEEVMEFLSDYRGVETYRTWFTHIPSLVLVTLAVSGSLNK